MSVKLFVFGGAPIHASGGDTLCPSHEYFAGLAASGANALELNMSFACAALLALFVPLVTNGGLPGPP
jgi:hypothetical protein